MTTAPYTPPTSKPSSSSPTAASSIRHDDPSSFHTNPCLTNIPGKRSVLIWGDSHAANLRSGLEASVPGVHFLQATASVCPGTLQQQDIATDQCKAFAAKIVQDYIPRYAIPFVVLNGDWKANDLSNIAGTVDVLRHLGVRVVLFGPTPRYDAPLPRLLAQSILHGDNVSAHLLTDQQILDGMMAQMAQNTWHVPYISLYTLLCPAQRCIDYPAPGVPLEYDDAHLTREGSAYLARQLQAKYPSLFAAQ